MLDGLRSHVCVDSCPNGYVPLLYEVSTPCEVIWRGWCHPIFSVAPRRKQRFSLLRGLTNRRKEYSKCRRGWVSHVTEPPNADAEKSQTCVAVPGTYSCRVWWPRACGSMLWSASPSALSQSQADLASVVARGAIAGGSPQYICLDTERTRCKGCRAFGIGHLGSEPLNFGGSEVR